MSSSAVRVPKPFYAPVPVNTGSLRKFGQSPRQAGLRESPGHLLPTADTDVVFYGSDGHLLVDDLLGTIIDLYA
ncbi:hypothetical protein JCM12296A_15840 [Desulfosarcina cetonica]